MPRSFYVGVVNRSIDDETTVAMGESRYGTVAHAVLASPL
jgi:hypothetical protein